MFRTLICLTALALVLGLVGNVSAELVAYWTFDEGSGDTVKDASGNGHDGIISGANWVAGKFGPALEFNGDGDQVLVPHDDALNIQGELTVEAWVHPKGWNPGLNAIAQKWEDGSNRRQYELTVYGATKTNWWYVSNAGNNWPRAEGKIIVELNEWTHLAGTYDGKKLRNYTNGTLDVELDQPNGIFASDIPVVIGGYGPTTPECTYGENRHFMGIIDEIRIYDHALLEAEILASMEGGVGYPYALGPDPKDGALHEDTWVTLSWSAGDFAVSHDVYLGDNYNEVSNATVDSDVFRGNQGATFYVAGFPGFAYPEGLVPGTTYYWRIDEVNEAHPESPWKGGVWSFSIPPKTAYNPDPADGAESVGPDDVVLSWTPGYGAKLHTVYFGDDFDTVANATGGPPGGIATYRPGPLDLEKVYYWRVDEFDAITTYKGDVWSFSTPGAVGSPQPAYNATDVAMNAILSWTASDSAASHQIYFGTDKAAVRSAGAGSSEDKGSVALGAESYDPGLLEAGTTYYWRVDEVDAQGNTAQGPLWIFTTGAFLVVDDFESYTDNDVDDEAIWQSWIDGFGVASNGAQVGYLVPPYCEQTIVHGGFQSMPLLYANETGVTNSEGVKTLTTPRDWTQAGVSELSLWIRGASGNAAEPLYVAISNSSGSSAVAAHDDPDAATVGTWREWRISLSAFADQGINLGNVDKIAIGLGTKSGIASTGGSGTMFIDDVRLYLQ